MRRFRILSSAFVSLAVISGASPGARSAAPVPVNGDLCTGGKASGTGLRGAYYSADPRASGPAMIRIDARVDSATVRRLPQQFTGKPLRSVKWCGWIRPIMSGPHRLQSVASAMRVEIAKQPVAGPGVVPGTPIQLEAGKAYAILIELPDAAGVGEFSLQWTPPFGVTYDVPPTVLFPPVETVQPGC